VTDAAKDRSQLITVIKFRKSVKVWPSCHQVWQWKFSETPYSVRSYFAHVIHSGIALKIEKFNCWKTWFTWLQLLSVITLMYGPVAMAMNPYDCDNSHDRKRHGVNLCILVNRITTTFEEQW